jgi:HD-like signal output (HDOD) protein
LKSLVLAHSLFREISSKDAASIERAQRNALATARIAQRLLRDEGSRQIAFTAGLLHHIGALAISTQLPDAERAILERMKDVSVTLIDAEREQLGATHPEIGAYMLGLWDLPHDIIEAVAGHHAPWSEFGTLNVGSAVAIASALGEELVDGRAGPRTPPEQFLLSLGITDVVAQIRAEFGPNFTASAPPAA